jgi:hypothetical protein
MSEQQAVSLGAGEWRPDPMTRSAAELLGSVALDDDLVQLDLGDLDGRDGLTFRGALAADEEIGSEMALADVVPQARDRAFECECEEYDDDDDRDDHHDQQASAARAIGWAVTLGAVLSASGLVDERE